MLNLSITSLDTEHIDEIVEDVVEQQRDGVSTHAMFMMKFNPEGTPAVNKAEQQCKKYDLFREKLDKVGAKHGVLVQATLGHITVPFEPYPFQPTVFLSSGEDRVVTCCPLDPNFRVYIKEQFRILAEHHPSIVMLDDDIGLMYKQSQGCACKYHMAELNRRLKKPITREELYQHTKGESEEDEYYKKMYVEVVADSIVGAVEAMREGLDMVDPTIQGVISGSYASTCGEFSDRNAVAFAGKGNPTIIRLNGGPYQNSIATGGARNFTGSFFRAAILKEISKDKVDIFLAETDTCPQNRYSTSATLLHSHFTASILEGATGAKHWLSRIGTYEPNSGKAYRKKLAKYSKFYEALCEYVKELHPFGCRLPLTHMENFFYKISRFNFRFAPWATSVLERFGLPLYFSNEGEGAVFIDDYCVDGFTDEEFKNFMKGTLILSVNAADKLCQRGFANELGVTVEPEETTTNKSGAAIVNPNKKVVSCEYIGKIRTATQYGKRELVPLSNETEWLSQVVHVDGGTGEIEPLYPGVTRHKTSFGGECIVFSGTPEMPFEYFTAFSLLNETRKKQFIEILEKNDLLPLYYPEDAELYLRAGKLTDGRLFAAAFNLSHDVLEDLPLVVKHNVKSVEMLNENGELVPVEFDVDGDKITVKETVLSMNPIVLILNI